MAARNRAVSAGGTPAGPTSGVNDQPISVVYGLTELIGQYVIVGALVLPNNPTLSLTEVNYV